MPMGSKLRWSLLKVECGLWFWLLYAPEEGLGFPMCSVLGSSLPAWGACLGPLACSGRLILLAYLWRSPGHSYLLPQVTWTLLPTSAHFLLTLFAHSGRSLGPCFNSFQFLFYKKEEASLGKLETTHFSFHMTYIQILQMRA